MTHQDEEFMRQAIKMAQEGIAQGQAPFGACLVRNTEILACTHNIVLQSGDITNHAEIHAIRTATKLLKTIDLSSCTMYSTNEPCPMCFSACHWARINKIYYGTSIEDAKELGFREISLSNKQMNLYNASPIHVTGNCLRFENLTLFDMWRNQQNHRVY